MNRQNWYALQLVNKYNMLALEGGAQAGTNALASYFNNAGIISGMAATQDTGLDMLLKIALGTVCLGDGTIVTTAAPRTVDLTALVPAAMAPPVTANVYAVPFQNSDTPVVIPSGDTINYHLFDDYNLVAQLSTAGAPANGVLLAQVALTAGQTAVINANISTANTQQWTTIAQLLAFINTLIAQNTQDRTVVAKGNVSGAIVLDASVASAWDMTLTNDVATVAVLNTYAGQRLRFIVQQDATGGRAWPWAVPGGAPSFRNTAPIDPGANSVNFIEAIVRADGFIYLLDAPTVYNP